MRIRGNIRSYICLGLGSAHGNYGKRVRVFSIGDIKLGKIYKRKYPLSAPSRIFTFLVGDMCTYANGISCSKPFFHEKILSGEDNTIYRRFFDFILEKAVLLVYTYYVKSLKSGVNDDQIKKDKA